MPHDQKHSYKLYYVDGRGRAEPIRLLFHYLGVEFNDFRMDREDMAEYMNKAPMRQLPFIEIDDGKITLCQTVSICRYLGKSVHPERWLGGATKTDSAKVDMMADGFADLYQMAMIAKYSPEEIKEVAMAQFKEKIGAKLKTMQDLLEKSKGEYFVGKSIHWCDVYILGVLQALDEFEDGIYDDLPELRAYYLHMRSLPELQKYIGSHWPPTNYKE